MTCWHFAAYRQLLKLNYDNEPHCAATCPPKTNNAAARGQGHTSKLGTASNAAKERAILFTTKGEFAKRQGHCCIKPFKQVKKRHFWALTVAPLAAVTKKKWAKALPNAALSKSPKDTPLEMWQQYLAHKRCKRFYHAINSSAVIHCPFQPVEGSWNRFPAFITVFTVPTYSHQNHVWLHHQSLDWSSFY